MLLIVRDLAVAIDDTNSSSHKIQNKCKKDKQYEELDVSRDDFLD